MKIIKIKYQKKTNNGEKIIKIKYQNVLNNGIKIILKNYLIQIVVEDKKKILKVVV